MTKIKVVTHSGGFHADDVFGVATLTLLLGEENIEVVRSRKPEDLIGASYVLDTGSVYDPDKNLFDHHQTGGAGERANGIPYASFGLIWKKFGAEIVGSQEVADAVDEYVVQPIDASDNGVELFFKNEKYKKLPFLIQSIVGFLEPARGEGRTREEAFAEAVIIARQILKRVIVHAETDINTKKFIREQYEKADDKTLIIFPEEEIISRVLIANILCEYPEPLYFVRHHEDRTWQVVCVTLEAFSYQHRKPLPETWRGKSDEELILATGVGDAVFCHRAGFMAVAKTKEGALALAKLALEA